MMKTTIRAVINDYFRICRSFAHLIIWATKFKKKRVFSDVSDVIIYLFIFSFVCKKRSKSWSL